MKDSEKFELSVSKILQENDFDFFYQFEIPLSAPDYVGKIKRVPDYIAAYKGLYLVIDAKAWNEIIVPPVLNSASGKVGHTINAVDALFWDACFFETGLLNSWTAKCPICGSSNLFGNRIYIKGPKEVNEDICVYVDDEALPYKNLDFGCRNCSEPEGMYDGQSPRFKSWELFPTVVPLIVSKTPFKTENGFEPFVHYLTPSGGYSAVMGEVSTHCRFPKHILMSQIDKLDEILKEIVSQKQFPQTLTIPIDQTAREIAKNPVNPNQILVAFTSKKRKESRWLTLGREAREKLCGKHTISELAEEDIDDVC